MEHPPGVLRIKDSKAQPPANKHALQGVDVHVRHDGVELSPTPRRVAKLRHAIAQSPGSNSLTPQEAGCLAGKLSFLTQAVFGAVGRSALQPIYARSHNTQADDQTLSVGLRSALSALALMLNDIRPRFLPNKIQPVLQAVVFADAYVRTGERLHKAGHVPSDLPLPAHDRDDNGWGYVVRIGQLVYFDHGTTPRSVLDAITSRKAFIYALEVYAGPLHAETSVVHVTKNGHDCTTTPTPSPPSWSWRPRTPSTRPARLWTTCR